MTDGQAQERSDARDLRGLRPHRWATTLTLGAMTAMTPLATDIYLPAMPMMARDLHASAATTQLTLSLFMLGFAFGQILYGPVSDRLGRRPAVLFSFALFALGSIACTVAPDMTTLLVARVAQGIGGAGPVVLARAMARDLYDGPEAGRELSRMAALMGFTPMIAPMIGALLLTVAGWRSNFALVAVVAVAFGLYLTLRLPETIRARRPEPLRANTLFAGFGELAAHPAFRVYMGFNALAFAGLFGFISVGSFVLQGVYGFNERQFAAAFGSGCLSFVVGSWISSRVMRRHGLSRSIGIGVSLLAFGGLAMLAATLYARSGVWLVLTMLPYWAGVGFVLPASLASAMAPFPHRAGAASSFVGVVQTLFGAGVGAWLGHAIATSPLPLPLCNATVGVAALALYLATRRLREAYRTH